jgi:hypothetical protein
LSQQIKTTYLKRKLPTKIKISSTGYSRTGMILKPLLLILKDKNSNLMQKLDIFSTIKKINNLTESNSKD